MEHTVTFTNYKIFFASSMIHPCRKEVDAAVNEANNRLKKFNISFDVLVYSETPVADTRPDTQATLNQKISESDFFILLAENKKPIGEKTMEEYEYAHAQSLSSHDKRPFIKAFATYKKNEEGSKMEINNVGEDGNNHNFEDRLFKDSKRYVECKLQEKFKTGLTEWLVNVAFYTFENNLTQKELSYSNHIHKISQGGIREDKNNYYRRDKLDGAIEKKLQESPIVILEGNTYSGKTRAAFEFMKSQTEWENYDFHIYDNRHTANELNKIHLDYNTRERGDIFLFDDINDILKGKAEINRLSPLWDKLNGYNELNGFSLEDFGSTRIIFTVSGKLTTEEKEELYCNIFNTTDNTKFRTTIQNIIINFDIYDRTSFRQMVDAMVRDGVLTSANIRPGNYTIGSLFIKTDDIRKMAKDQYKLNSNLIKTLVAHFKYAEKSRYKGLIAELLELYNFIGGCNDNQDDFENHLEELRKKGLIVTTKEQQKFVKIEIDKYVLEAFTEVVQEKFGIGELYKLLIDYVREYSGHETHHSCSVAQMGYWLIKRNKLNYSEIIRLIDLVVIALDVKPEGECELREKLEEITKAIEEITKAIEETEKDKTYRRISLEDYKDLIEGQKKEQERLKIEITELNQQITELNQQKTGVDMLIKSLVEITKKSVRYSMSFTSSAIANIPDFEVAETLLDACRDYPDKDSERKEIATKLYKQAVYAMFSTNNRNMTMGQELQIIKRIQNEEHKWIAPFDEADLKNVAFLSRITTFMKKMNAKDIIEQLSSTTLDGYIDNDNQDVYEKIYLQKLSDATIAALSRVDNYAEFEEVIAAIQGQCEKSEHVKRAIEKAFTEKFYSIAPTMILKFNYTDRISFFDFIYNINDKKGILSNFELTNEKDIKKYRSWRIFSLNQILEHLDENGALEAYTKMIKEKLCDMRTLSYLLKNDFLNFEQSLRFIDKDDGQSNYLTYNQLMGKAATLSDADVCMRLMGIKDLNPCKIQDESALANYLKIKEIDNSYCIKIIKNHENEFSDAIITLILKKFETKQLIDIFTPKGEGNEGYYKEEYGLLDKEIERIRKNAIHLGIFFNRNDIDQKVLEENFNKIAESDELRTLISDPEVNGNDPILNAYMKKCCKNYKDARNFYDNLEEGCKPPKPTHYIYKVFLDKIINDFKSESYDRSKAIEKLNKELVCAFKNFAEHYAKEDVIKYMSALYSYRPLLVNKENFGTEKEKFVYEEKEMDMTFQEYLTYLKKHNTSYADGSFIYNTLTIMKESIDENGEIVYGLLCDIASLNHVGVQYDKIKNNKKLSETIQQRLFNIIIDKENNLKEIKIDERLVYNVSYTKVIWFLINSGLMTFEDAESFRKEKRLLMTQTYLNQVFKSIELETSNEWYKENNNETFKKGYERLETLMCSVFPKDNPNPYLHKSIQMCISMIAVAPDKESLDKIFKEVPTGFGFGDFKNRTEAIAARMKKILQLYYKSDEAKGIATLSEFKEMIISNPCNINIIIINTYLSVYVKIEKKEIKCEEKLDWEPFKKCWDTLKESCKVDVFELLGVDDSKRNDIIKELGITNGQWMIDANVQTFSYFSKYDPDLISTMDKKFEGDFFYAKGKSCLKDTLKNYSFNYDGFEESTRSKELKFISELLSKKENYKVFTEICNDYIIKSKENIIKSKQKNGAIWVMMNTLWKDLLDIQEFKTQVARRICNSAMRKNPDRIVELNIEIEDEERIGVLHNALQMDKFDDKLKEEINNCYDKLIKFKPQNDASSKNAELFKKIFSLPDKDI